MLRQILAPSSSSISIGLLAVTLCLTALASGPLVGQNTNKPNPEELRALIDQNRQELIELTDSLRHQPDDEQLWLQWFNRRTMLQNFEALLHGEDPRQLDPEVAERQAKERLREWFDGWRAELPESAALELVRLQVLTPQDQAVENLEQLATRFPEHSRTAERLVAAHLARGSLLEATAAAENFLARNPRDESAYPLLHRCYERTGDQQKAADLAEAWIQTRPSDAEAHILWWRYHAETIEPSQLPEYSRQVASRLSGENKARWCQHLTNSNQIDHDTKIGCFNAALAEIDETSRSFKYALTTYTRLLHQIGDQDAFEQAFARLPAEQQETIRGRMTSALLEDRECDQALSILRGSENPGSVLVQASPRLPNCLGHASFREGMIEIVSTADPGDARALFNRADDQWPIERFEAAFRGRTDISAVEIFKTLDVLFQKAGDIDKRLALLESWNAHEPFSDGRQVVELAELYWIKQDPEAAVRLLKSYVQGQEGHESFPVVEQLVALHVALDDLQAATDLGQELLAREGRSRGHGALLLARLAAFRGELGEARDLYELFFDTAPLTDWTLAEDYPGLLLSLGDISSIERHFFRQWELLSESPQLNGQGREEWIGDQLLEWSFEESALKYYEQAMASGSDSRQLLDKSARLAEKLEMRDRAAAWRQRVLERAPMDPGAWYNLARNHFDQGDIEAAFEVMDQAFDRLRQPDDRLWNLWADAILATDLQQGELNETTIIEAIDVLKQAAEVFDHHVYSRARLRDRLATLYNHLGRGMTPVAEASSSPSPAAPVTTETAPTAAPDGSSVEEILALADQLNSGAAGRFDLPRARELYEQAASTGDPVATVRLATLLHLGTCGFESAPERAEKLATPMLDGVRQRARAGEAKAQYVYGTALLVGVGTPAKPEAAVEWLRSSAAQGEAWAMFNLGWMFASGTGVIADLPTALDWYAKAGAAGHVDGMWNVAHRRLQYDYGDPDESIAWLERAAQSGASMAQRLLAETLESGRFGQKRDLVRARHWFERAADQGDLVAAGWLKAHSVQDAD